MLEKYFYWREVFLLVIFTGDKEIFKHVVQIRRIIPCRYKKKRNKEFISLLRNFLIKIKCEYLLKSRKTLIPCQKTPAAQLHPGRRQVFLLAVFDGMQVYPARQGR